jgi:hypothetical protein
MRNVQAQAGEAGKVQPPKFDWDCTMDPLSEMSAIGAKQKLEDASKRAVSFHKTVVSRRLTVLRKLTKSTYAVITPLVFPDPR